MACLFGARLTPHADVTLIGSWPEQIAALRRAPLRLQYPDGREEQIPLRATNDPESVEPVDAALILVKSGKTEDTAQAAARLLEPGGLALTLQNGLGNLEVLARHVGEDRAALGVTTLGASTDGPGVLRFGGEGVTTLAVRPEIEARVRALADLFRQAGLQTDVAEDVSSLVWGKLTVNCAINPLTALLRVPNGALLESPWSCNLMIEAAREVQAVARAQGIVLPYEDAGAQAEEVARWTAANRSSMLQDVLRGADTEIEALNGAVVRIGEQEGVPTPVNGVLYRLVKAIEQLAVSD